MKLKIIILLFLLQITIPINSYPQENNLVSDYLNVLNEKGKTPIDFVNNVLIDHDLLIFDDALHLAKEPFDFYQQLVRDSFFISNVKYIFIEVFSITSQPYIDKYINNPVKDSTILLPVFQNDFSGLGWHYKTYLDLFGTLWDVNSKLPEPEKIKIVFVDQPVYWEGIHTRNDYNLFQKSLVARDYFMYKMISQTLNNFKDGNKGIFLTNTRHAYKNIRNSNNNLYWNTGTFFYHWHPGKTYSIRFHNVNLSIKSESDRKTNISTEGMEKYSYSWIRMENGLWDKAFRENGNVPVAISLEDNIFGKANYVGNHMANVPDNQTMYDAYDGLIFLAPLEELHFSGTLGFIYTESFIPELKRRIKLLHGEQLPDFLSENEADSLDDFIKQLMTPQKPKKNKFVPAEQD